MHHTYVGTDCGKKWHAWIAGPTRWYCCHTKGKSKPCLTEVTDGELSCPRCGEILPPETIGYVPLYRESDGKPVMVIVHEYTREVVDALRFHQRVMVGREAEQSDGVYVVPALAATPRYVTTVAVRQRPVDITDCLLRLWGYTDLAEWHYRTEGLPLPGVYTPLATKPAPPAVSPPVVLPPSVKPVNETTDAALNRIFGSLNGKAAKLKSENNGDGH